MHIIHAWYPNTQIVCVRFLGVVRSYYDDNDMMMTGVNAAKIVLNQNIYALRPLLDVVLALCCSNLYSISLLLQHAVHAWSVKPQKIADESNPHYTVKLTPHVRPCSAMLQSVYISVCFQIWRKAFWSKVDRDQERCYAWSISRSNLVCVDTHIRSRLLVRFQPRS